MAVPPSELVARASAVATRFVEPIVDLTAAVAAVPAPTNDEAVRAAFVAETYERLGLVDVTVDALSNVVARIPGAAREPALLLAAHTDTVFPRDVPIEVVRTGDRLAAPGIGDNSLSVAAVALVGQGLAQLGFTPPVDVWVTGNVGEEGLGDLRGMRAVMDTLDTVGAAIAVEGHSLGRITNRAVGSRRLRVTVTGPGGHSWGDAGRPSAIHALARLVTSLDEIDLGGDAKTSLNVGLFTGGISVNTIAPEATAVIDLRSVSAASLASLVRDVEVRIAAVATSSISVATEVVGDRPAGALPDNEGLVPIGVDVLAALGMSAVCDASSTDANIPISRGIPSMCIGLTSGGNVHRVDEYIRIPPIVVGFTQLLLDTILATEALARGELPSQSSA
ncbi:MAG TPA: M20/M25/M40 family metallo-hydrolase [Thermomicrobiales bacterium]|nr:M20/M25/M40 family metallo-hydrolase [Thermomicrobiales bacterium]